MSNSVRGEPPAAMRLVPAAAVVVILIVAIGGAALTSPSRPPSGQSPADVPTGEPDPYAQPIYDADEATNRTLAALPGYISVTQVAARLVTSSTLESEWTEDDVTAWMDDAPLWLVGVVAEGLQQGDVAQVAPGFSLVQDASAVPGAFMLWNANSGTLLMSGSLEASDSYNATASALGAPTIDPAPGYDFRMERLLEIQDDPVTIVHATTVP